jgi:hypothetical protein
VLRPSASAPQPAAPANPAARPTPTVRRDTFGSAPANPAPPRAGTPEAAGSEQPVPGAALKSLRDRLVQRQQR